MSKEKWFREFERLYNEKLDAGIPDKKAYDQAADEAAPALWEKIADMADEARLLFKETKP